MQTLHDVVTHYDPARLFWKVDRLQRRHGVYHPALPTVRAIGYHADVFMGWTMDEARAACTYRNDDSDR